MTLGRNMDNYNETIQSEALVVDFIKEEDAVQMIELQMRLAGETDFLMRELDEVEIDAEKQREAIRKSISDDASFLFGVYLKGKLLGYISGSKGSFSRNKHVAKFTIGILKAYWGQGASSAIMDAFIKWSTEVKITRIEIEVVEDNERALAFCNKYGFKIEGRKEADHYVREGLYMNTYILSKIIDRAIMLHKKA